MWNNISILLGAAAPLVLMLVLWMVAQISRRFGEVTRHPPYYRIFYVAMGLMSLPLLVRLLSIGLTERQLRDLGGNTPEALLHDIPLAVSIALTLAITWRYWGWLVYAREGEPRHTARHRSDSAPSSRKQP